ncbi:MAG: hypothetical protein AB7W16_01765 [Candidatus Obscuribacterales bacterium]
MANFLTIQAECAALSPEWLDRVNENLASFVRVIEIDLVDTGFFEAAGSDRLLVRLLVKAPSDVTVGEVNIQADKENVTASREVPLEIPEEPTIRVVFEISSTLRLQAAEVLQHVTDKYGVDSKTFRVRAFHLRSDERRRIAEQQKWDEREDEPAEEPPDKPDRFAIDHDDYHARHIGRTADGRQFFLTYLFVPALGDDQGNEFVALFLFDKEGQLLEARIDEFGPRSDLDLEERSKIYEKRLQELGPVSFERIEIAPFSIDRDGVAFGFIAKAFDGTWSVELHPGNFMAFYEPWDSGEYDT